MKDRTGKGARKADQPSGSEANGTRIQSDRKRATAMKGPVSTARRIPLLVTSAESRDNASGSSLVRLPGKRISGYVE